jgi:hypothetical protein
MIRTDVEYFTARVYAMNASVYSAFCVMASFCHCDDTCWKGEEGCFPVWNADKIASSTSLMSAAAYCMEIDAGFFDPKSSEIRHSASMYGRRCNSVFDARRDTLPKFPLENYCELHGNSLEFL